MPEVNEIWDWEHAAHLMKASDEHKKQEEDLHHRVAREQPDPVGFEITSIESSKCPAVEYSIETCPEREVMLRRFRQDGDEWRLVTDELTAQEAIKLGQQLIDTANKVLVRKTKL